MTPRPRLRPRSGELFILISIGVVILTALTGHLEDVFRVLYSPYAAFVAVVMLIEYIVLKGADRSAVYQRELEAARAKRREELLAMKKIETTLESLKRSLDSARDRERASPGETPTPAPPRRVIEELLEQLRSRN